MQLCRKGHRLRNSCPSKQQQTATTASCMIHQQRCLHTGEQETQQLRCCTHLHLLCDMLCCAGTPAEGQGSVRCAAGLQQGVHEQPQPGPLLRSSGSHTPGHRRRWATRCTMPCQRGSSPARQVGDTQHCTAGVWLCINQQSLTVSRRQLQRGLVLPTSIRQHGPMRNL